MHRRVVLVLVAFLGVALAGCADQEPSPEEQNKKAAQTQVVDVPEWNIGDYWAYELPSGVTSSFVVTGTEGGEYIVETDDSGVAYYDARYDISYLGKVRKSDLAGSQGSERVAMFQWPLEHDKAWTTTWDGDELNMFATAMGVNQFHVMGHRASDEAMTVEYHYNAEKKWFEYIVFYDPDNGTEESFRMDLKSSGTDYQGEIYRYAFGDVLHFAATSPEESGFEEQDIPADWNELALTLHFDCEDAPAGVMGVGLSSEQYRQQSPAPMAPMLNDPEHSVLGFCHETTSSTTSLVIENEGGTWEIGLIAGAPETLAMAVIEERARTVLPFPFS